MKILVVLGVICLVLFIGATIAFKVMFPPEKIQQIAGSYAKEYLDREISFDSVSLALIGIKLNNFAISENATFDKGTFAKADKLIVKVSLLPLLKRQIDISTIGLDGFEVDIIKGKDGKFNFDSILEKFSSEDTAAQAEEATEETASKDQEIPLVISKFYIKDSSVKYTDLQENMSASVTELSAEAENINFDEAFNFNTSFHVKYDGSGMSVDIPVRIKTVVNLAKMNLDNATFTLNYLSAKIKDAEFTAKGGVKNFNAPEVAIEGALKGLNNKSVDTIVPDLPKFALPDVNFNVSAFADLNKSTFDVKDISVSMKNTKMQVKGIGSWLKDVIYSMSATLSTDLSDVNSIAPETLKEFNVSDITGKIAANLNITEKTARGSVDLSKIGVSYNPMIQAKDINGKITINSFTNFKSGTITGKINDADLKTDFSFADAGKDLYNVVFNADLASLTIKELPASAAAEETPAPAAQPAKAQPSAGPYFNVKANVKVGAIRVPFFSDESMSLTADLKNVDATLAKTDGTVTFNMGKGKIEDLAKLISANKITKVLFMVVFTVHRVTDYLKLDLFSKSDSKTIEMASMDGKYTFTKGAVKIDETKMVSTVSTIQASGSADFNTDKLDMKASATIGKNGTPIVIKITGTMSEPKGSLDTLSTVTSLVPGTVGIATGTAKDVVSNATDAVKQIGSLFKKKDKDTESK
ncbi:AsmA protein [Parelusimicrobium proximum]